MHQVKYPDNDRKRSDTLNPLKDCYCTQRTPFRNEMRFVYMRQA